MLSDLTYHFLTQNRQQLNFPSMLLPAFNWCANDQSSAAILTTTLSQRPSSNTKKSQGQ
jgi:hypothetical protein